jgi:hypothetical protein
MKIKMHLKKLLIIWAVVLLSGCATAANYEKILNGWVGASEDNLLATWGPPNNVYSSGGMKYLTFGGASGMVFMRGMAIPVSCQTTFTIAEATRTITTWRYEGNACKANPS